MIISVAQAQLFFLALTRILAVIIQVPVIGGNSVPNLVKIGLGFLLATVLLVWQPVGPAAPPMALAGFGLAIGRELLIGTLAGFSAVLTFAALQIAGEMMGLVSGFAASRIINPALDTSGSAINQFFFLVAILYFLVIDGHHAFLIALQRTFTLIPLNVPLPDLTAARLLTLSSGLIATGIQMALPVIGALLLTDLTLGLLARVAPQMQVFFLGVPLKVGVSLIALAVSLALVLPSLVDLYRAMSLRMLELLGG